MNALAASTPPRASRAYMAELEARLAQAVERRAGLRGRASRPRRSRPAASGCGRCSASSPRRRDRERAAARGRRRGRARPHGDARPRRPRRRRAHAAGRPLRVVGLRPGGGARRPATTSSRARSPSSPRPATRRAVAMLADACLALARGEAMQRAPDARPGDDDRRLPRALRAQDGEALRGRVPARLGRRPGARRLRPRARDRLPDRRRHPRLRRPDPGDGEDPRHRPARGHADDAAAARRAAGRGRARARSPAGPLDGALVRVAATDALARSREAALDYAAKARVVPRLRRAPRGARSPDLRRRGSGKLRTPDGDRTRHHASI